MIKNVDVDLIKYKSILTWTPKIGDMVFRDGGLFRWCALVIGIKDDNVHIRKSGCPALLLTGEYKEETTNTIKIKNSRLGAYFVVSDGVYFT